MSADDDPADGQRSPSEPQEPQTPVGPDPVAAGAGAGSIEGSAGQGSSSRAVCADGVGAAAVTRLRTPVPGPDDRDPQPIAASVDDLVSERGWTEPIAVGGVEGRWPQIVGADIAAHCVPEEFEAGRLTVRTDSTAWATQVRMLAPTPAGQAQRRAGCRDGHAPAGPRPAGAVVEEGAAPGQGAEGHATPTGESPSRRQARQIGRIQPSAYGGSRPSVSVAPDRRHSPGIGILSPVPGRIDAPSLNGRT